MCTSGYGQFLVIVTPYGALMAAHKGNRRISGKHSTLWPYGPMALWPYGSMVLWPFGTMALWPYGPLALWSMTLWHYGPMVLWHYDPMTLWPFGTMSLWPYGPMAVPGCGLSPLSSPRVDAPHLTKPRGGQTHETSQLATPHRQLNLVSL